jgi:hypothetical protein
LRGCDLLAQIDARERLRAKARRERFIAAPLLLLAKVTREWRLGKER